MYCLDTSTVIAVFRGKETALRAKMEQMRESGANFAITTITLCELYQGAFLSSSKEQGLAQINAFLESVTLLLQDKMSCLLFGQDYALLKERGMQTQEMDLMIAAICKAKNAVLVTSNVKDFRNIPKLMVEKW